MEEDKFIEVLKAHRRIIYKVISIYCSDDEDKKDIEQEVVIQLWKAFSKYNNKYKYSTWVYKITMNVAITFYRSKEKITSKTTSLNESIFEMMPNPVVEESDEKILLDMLIQQLEKFDREILVLYLEEYSHIEIADLLGISVSNVATKINRIKTKLKQNSIKFKQGKNGTR